MSDLTPELINRVTWKIPNVLCLVGSRSGDTWNAMTTSWVSQVSMEPVLIAISVDNKAVTHRLISESGVFTVNLWDRQDTRPFVKFSKPAEKDGDTLNGRAFTEGTTGAPVFDEAVAYLECEVRSSYDVGTHTLFLGEVVAAGIRDDEAGIAAMSDTRMKYGGVKRH
jgi:flavin reductase (DIM6/NTAB) family NADH-FMN oxidoreductase RutF